MLSIQLEKRISFTTKLNEYDVENSYLCVPGEYNCDIFYDDNRNIAKIILNHPHYGLFIPEKLKTIYCTLSNSNSYIVIGDDDKFFRSNGVKLNREDNIKFVLASQYIAASTLIPYHQTQIDVSTCKNSDGLITALVIDFNYTSLIF